MQAGFDDSVAQSGSRRLVRGRTRKGCASLGDELFQDVAGTVYQSRDVLEGRSGSGSAWGGVSSSSRRACPRQTQGVRSEQKPQSNSSSSADDSLGCSAAAIDGRDGGDEGAAVGVGASVWFSDRSCTGGMHPLGAFCKSSVTCCCRSEHRCSKASFFLRSSLASSRHC